MRSVNVVQLTCFLPLVSFCTPWKHQKTRGLKRVKLKLTSFFRFLLFLHDCFLQQSSQQIFSWKVKLFIMSDFLGEPWSFAKWYYLMPLFLFIPPWKHQKTSSFFVFSGGIESDQCYEMVHLINTFIVGRQLIICWHKQIIVHLLRYMLYYVTSRRKVRYPFSCSWNLYRRSEKHSWWQKVVR